MAGLRFDVDTDPVDPNTTLGSQLPGWVEALAADRSRRTVDAYVSDAAVVATALADVLERDHPQALDDLRQLRQLDLYPPQWAKLRAARDSSDGLLVAKVTYIRARLALDQLALIDLHPKNLTRAFARLGATRAASTRARAYAAWSSYCDYLVREGLLAANPMTTGRLERPKATTALPKPLTLKETNQLLAAVATLDESARRPWPERDVALAVTFLATGARLSELRLSHVNDITYPDDTPSRTTATAATTTATADQGARVDDGVGGQGRSPARVRATDGARIRLEGKGGKTRVVPLYPEAVPLLESYLLSRRRRLGPFDRADPLFVRADGTAFTARALRRLVERWFVRAGVRRTPGACVHALRHTFATLALDSGANVLEVRDLLGHNALSTTQRYLLVVGSGLEDAVRAHSTRALVARLSAS